jgi:hypothetical protein
MPRRLPALAIILGIAGLLPFVLLGVGSVTTNTLTSPIAAYLLVGYGAVILSFIGAVHWGFTLATEHDPAERPRLALGIVPALVGWSALAVTIPTREPVLGLVVLILGFIVTAVVEWRAHGRGWVPGGYIGLRLGLTAMVVLILTTAMGVRMIGGHLIM